MSRVLEFSVSYNFRALGKFLQIHIKVLCGRIFHSQWCETIIVFWGSLTKVTSNHASISQAHQLLSHINILVTFEVAQWAQGQDPHNPIIVLLTRFEISQLITLSELLAPLYFILSPTKSYCQTILRIFKGGCYSIFLTIPIILVYIFNMIDTSVTKTCFTQLTGFR